MQKLVYNSMVQQTTRNVTSKCITEQMNGNRSKK
jgi:hypothetical protein